MKWLLLLAPCLAALLRVACPLRICAFNIQTFGDNKVDNEAVAKVIVKVSSHLGRGGEEEAGSPAQPSGGAGGSEGKVVLLGSKAPPHTHTEAPGRRPDLPVQLLIRAPCLFQILSRYDIALVQEVRDSDLSAVTTLMEKLNRCGHGGRAGGSPTGVPKDAEGGADRSSTGAPSDIRTEKRRSFFRRAQEGSGERRLEGASSLVDS